MNTPFTKEQVLQFKKDRNVKFLPSGEQPNRKNRRAIFQKEPPHNNGMLKAVQWIQLKDGSFKKIKHYDALYKYSGGVRKSW